MIFNDYSKWPFVINLSNGIIGVSVLAMPFCMHKCGIALGLLVLVSSAALTRITCNLLVQGALICQRQTYEQFAYHIFGRLGKSLVELCLILYTKATLIAFFVVIGDLGQSVLLPMVSENSYVHRDIVTNFRTLFTLVFALAVVLPLCLLKNIRSLSLISSLAVLFYGCLIVYLFLNSLENITTLTTWTKLNYWRWDGVLQCMPIFFTSLSCQTQIFVISNEVPNSTPLKMDAVIGSAVNLCSAAYFSIGLLGYAGFYDKGDIPGDIMMLLNGSFSAQLIKLGFLFSVAVSYPIMIFPCRAAIYSMMMGERRSKSLPTSSLEKSNETYIPDLDLKLITLFLIAFNLIVALMVPNMELILAISGSLISSLICFIIPAVLFLSCKQVALPFGTKHAMHDASRFHAKISLFVGLVVLIFGTYATLNDHGSDEDDKTLIAAQNLALSMQSAAEVPAYTPDLLNKSTV